MDKKEWIAPRRESLNAGFKLTDTDRQEAEELFARMEAVAATCDDQGTFEQRIYADGLTQEYTDLITRLSAQLAKGPSASRLATDMAKSRLQTEADIAVRRTVGGALDGVLPEGVNDFRRRGLRALPVIGDIIGWTDRFYVVRRLIYWLRG